MDILDILLDILLKPPQPLMGLFFSLCQECSKLRVLIALCLQGFSFYKCYLTLCQEGFTLHEQVLTLCR